MKVAELPPGTKEIWAKEDTGMRGWLLPRGALVRRDVKSLRRARGWLLCPCPQPELCEFFLSNTHPGLEGLFDFLCSGCEGSAVPRC